MLSSTLEWKIDFKKSFWKVQPFLIQTILHIIFYPLYHPWNVAYFPSNMQEYKVGVFFLHQNQSNTDLQYRPASMCPSADCCHGGSVPNLSYHISFSFLLMLRGTSYWRTSLSLFAKRVGLVLGGGVGKSALTVQFVHDIFRESGISFCGLRTLIISPKMFFLSWHALSFIFVFMFCAVWLLWFSTPRQLKDTTPRLVISRHLISLNDCWLMISKIDRSKILTRKVSPSTETKSQWIF